MSKQTSGNYRAAITAKIQQLTVIVSGIDATKHCARGNLERSISLAGYPFLPIMAFGKVDGIYFFGRLLWSSAVHIRRVAAILQGCLAE
jgi:hypothetical protein